MTDDAWATTDPADAAGAGERRRALQAERERQAERARLEEPSDPTLVRPYTRFPAPAEPGSRASHPEPFGAAGPDDDERPAFVVVEADAAPPWPIPPSGEPARDRAPESAAAPPTPPPEEPPEPEPAGWSAFTPVIPPEPPADEEPLFSPGWEHVSVRRGDDEAWIRGLRDPGEYAGEPLDELPDEPLEESSADSPSDLVADLGVEEPSEQPVDDEGSPPRRRGGGPDDDPGQDLLAAGGAAGAAPLHGPPFGRTSAHRLSEAFGRGGAQGPMAEATPAPADGAPGSARPATPGEPYDEEPYDEEPYDEEPHDEEPHDEEPLRGTLAPVLRHSTERARPPAGSPVLAPVPDRSPTSARPLTWDEAMSGDVVPGTKKRPGRRIAKARHESGGAGEYRPRAAPDRSLTLLVVGMLLVLLALLGIAAWAMWPRVLHSRSLPPGRPAATSGDVAGAGLRDA